MRNSHSKSLRRLGISNRALLPLEEQKSLILEILVSFSDDADDLVNFLKHAGFDPRVMATRDHLIPAWLGHYRIKSGVYDIERACRDLASWPPIASRISHLMREKHGVSQLICETALQVHIRRYGKTVPDRVFLYGVWVLTTKTECHLGGSRSWFVCPTCNRRCAILYPKNCRKCVKGRYAKEAKTTGPARLPRRLRCVLDWAKSLKELWLRFRQNQNGCAGTHTCACVRKVRRWRAKFGQRNT